MKRLGFGRATGVLALSLTLTLAACDDDDPVGPDPVEVASAEWVAGETTLVEVVGETVTGAFDVEVDGETDAFDLVVYDEDDEEIDLTTYHLSVEIDDEAVAEWVADGEEAFRGHIEGLTEGTTTVVFRITTAAGGAGTEIWASPEIDIVVSGA